MKTPQNIVCLTEESVEILYLLGQEKLIKGVSIFVKRPESAQKLPKVTQFTRVNLKKIRQINPDLIIGFSDIQKDIARELIGEGFNVWISNQRSLKDILCYTQQLGYLIGAQKKTDQLIKKLESKMASVQKKVSRLKYRPRVYFEEWDEPQITAIKWVSEIIELAGGQNIFAQKSQGSLAKDRFVTVQEIADQRPDIILTSWCGKKFNKKSLIERLSPHPIPAIKNNRIYDLPPEIFLQPGPAPILAGLDILLDIFGQSNYS